MATSSLTSTYSSGDDDDLMDRNSDLEQGRSNRRQGKTTGGQEAIDLSSQNSEKDPCCTCGNFTKVAGVALIVIGALFTAPTYFDLIDHKIGVLAVFGCLLVAGVWLTVMQVFPTLGEATRKHAKLNRVDRDLLVREERNINRWEKVGEREAQLNRDIGGLQKDLEELNKQLQKTQAALEKERAAIQATEELAKRLIKSDERTKDSLQAQTDALDDIDDELEETNRQRQKFQFYLENDLPQAEDIQTYLQTLEQIFARFQQVQEAAIANKKQIASQVAQLQEITKNNKESEAALVAQIQEFYKDADSTFTLLGEHIPDFEVLITDFSSDLQVLIDGARTGRSKAQEKLKGLLPKLVEAQKRVKASMSRFRDAASSEIQLDLGNHASSSTAK